MISAAASKYIYHQEPGIVLLHGDCLEVLRAMDDCSIDAIVTDPPYGLSFMGKKWDIQVPSVEVWAEVLRVLKPGGHMLCFAGSRTYHRMAVNIEDAGFEIRDQIQWLYGSGFPKNHDISKAIDKGAGVVREKIKASEKGGNIISGAGNSRPWHEDPEHVIDGDIPATHEAEQWEGWGTALKPAHEPICLARKPLEGTIAENVLEHGTGGINIDECRVGPPGDKSEHFGAIDKSECNLHEGGIKERVPADNSKGRWPANVIMAEDAGNILDDQSGDVKVGGGDKGNKKENSALFGKGKIYSAGISTASSGGASRFFYCPKASKADRDEGMEGMPLKECGMMEDDNYPIETGSGNIRDTKRRNNHPTVKPTDLMQYLVRLVTPPEGIVLDPFMGSGSTGKACMREGFKFIGIEREEDYMPIALARIKAPAQVEML